jgi:hypothetical protein
MDNQLLYLVDQYYVSTSNFNTVNSRDIFHEVFLVLVSNATAAAGKFVPTVQLL